MQKALLVIDMLKDFLEESGSLYMGETAAEIRKNVAARVEQWRRSGDPLFYIIDRHIPGDAEFDMFPPHCLAGEQGGEIVEEIAPREGDYLVPKRRFSAFFATDLDLTLRELKVEELELVGVCTQICILYTAADARMRGYHVIVREGSVGSFDRDAHHFTLTELENTLGVKVIRGEK